MIISILVSMVFARIGINFAKKIESSSLIGHVMVVGCGVFYFILSVGSSANATLMLMSYYRGNRDELNRYEIFAVILVYSCLFQRCLNYFNTADTEQRIKDFSFALFAFLGALPTYGILKRIL